MALFKAKGERKKFLMIKKNFDLRTSYATKFSHTCESIITNADVSENILIVYNSLYIYLKTNFN